MTVESKYIGMSFWRRPESISEVIILLDFYSGFQPEFTLSEANMLE
jgi:hypothetical protein